MVFNEEQTYGILTERVFFGDKEASDPAALLFTAFFPPPFPFPAFCVPFAPFPALPCDFLDPEEVFDAAAFFSRASLSSSSNFSRLDAIKKRYIEADCTRESIDTRK